MVYVKDVPTSFGPLFKPLLGHFFVLFGVWTFLGFFGSLWQFQIYPKYPNTQKWSKQIYKDPKRSKNPIKIQKVPQWSWRDLKKSKRILTHQNELNLTFFHVLKLKKVGEVVLGYLFLNYSIKNQDNWVRDYITSD